LELFIILSILVIAIGTSLFFYYKKKPLIKNNSNKLYTEALNMLVRGDSQNAIRLLRDVVKQDTNHLDAYLQLGDILRDEGNSQNAIKIHQSLTVRPGLDDKLQIQIHQSLAKDYLSLNEISLAKKEAEMILNIDKKEFWATEFLLDLAEKSHDWAQAAHLIKTLDSNNSDITRLARFKVYEGMGKFENDDRKGAEQCFNKAIEIAPNFGLPHLYLGNLFSENRNLVKALEHWEQYALLDLKNGSSIYSKIESALFDLGRFSEVEKFYQRALKNNPRNLDALAKIANVLEEKGERQKALDLVEDALSQHQDSIKLRLMKLKLSIQYSSPPQLSQQIDKMIDIMTSQTE
jgi:lipopolysaccharide biosynthesis regulator YciM|tara:strand:- start:3733 stop:4776 length:1044 start_codon:yes stop_codon:yes gene_type:complete